MIKRNLWLIITAGVVGLVSGTVGWAQETNTYHTNRTFTPVIINLPDNPTVDQIYTAAMTLTDIVKGTNITINTNETYAIEKQVALPVCYGSAEGAWNAALAYNGTTSNYPGKIFDNVGWVRGTKSVNGEWGAYLCVLQNRIAFKSSETNWWISPSNGVPVAISNVMVGTLGDYAPMEDVVDVGPSLDQATNNFPGENTGEDKRFRADITNVYYRLVIPFIWITPRAAVRYVFGSNVQYTVAGTNISGGVTWTINPAGLSSGAVIQASNDWHYAGVTPGSVATNYKVRATSVDNTNFYDEVLLTVTNYNLDLIPDYNRDGNIDNTDRARVATNESFHFWINDDDDSGYGGGDDIPGDGSADSGNGIVDGVRDLVDFFPVWVDIKDTLAILSTNEYDYVLKHQSGALNVFACNSMPVSSNPDLKPNAFLYSTNFGNTYGSFSVDQVSSSGSSLPAGFLGEIINNDRGIILLEGRTTTTAPLVLVVRRKSDSVVVAQKEMPLSLSGVENMYRHINLRPDSDGHATSTSEPSNYPDSLCNSKNVFFIHGFHCDGEDARGINAEMFKRLYWSGSNAKFWGITWQGDVGWPDWNHYHDNVANAFSVATNLTAQINGISGAKVIVAHSLGNMVVSSAIQDVGLSVSKYFMLNAAVATESYWPAAFNDSTNGNYMQHDDWWGYNSNTWCSTWFRLFSAPDDRAKLTWQDRFPGVDAYNFYSSGDEILEVYTNSTPSVPTGWWDFERYSWQKQEVFKGRSILGGTSWAGWGFSDEYTMAEANNATPDNLRTNAVFRHNPNEMFSSNIAPQEVNNILAQAVPALSYAAGKNAINIGGFANYNDNDETHKPNGWPRSGGDYDTRWLHSDYKNMAFLYTYDLFKEIVSQGGLQ